MHETAHGMTEAGVMAKRTMKVFDEMCLTPVEDMAPKRIREIRRRENASQAGTGPGAGVGSGVRLHPSGFSYLMIPMTPPVGS